MSQPPGDDEGAVCNESAWDAVADQTHQRGFAKKARAGSATGALASVGPGFEYLAAAMCRGAAILFVKLYARLTSAVQRTFIDPFKYVRPGSTEAAEAACPCVSTARRKPTLNSGIRLRHTVPMH